MQIVAAVAEEAAVVEGGRVACHLFRTLTAWARMLRSAPQLADTMTAEEQGAPALVMDVAIEHVTRVGALRLAAMYHRLRKRRAWQRKGYYQARDQSHCDCVHEEYSCISICTWYDDNSYRTTVVTTYFGMGTRM